MESEAFHKAFLLLPIPWETGAAKKARYCMKKRLLSGLLLLAMLLTLLPTMALADNVVSYGINIDPTNDSGDRTITSANYKDFYGNGKVSYDPETKTLTLKNAKLIRIWANEVDLTLKLVGTNTVMNGDGEALIIAQGLTITGDGSLTVRNSYCSSIAIDLRNGAYIQKSGNVILHGSLLTMSGVGMLRLEGGSLKLEKGYNGLFDSNPSLELPEGGKLTLTFGGEPKTAKTWEGPISAGDWETIKRKMTDAESVTMERPVEEDNPPVLPRARFCWRATTTPSATSAPSTGTMKT